MVAAADNVTRNIAINQTNEKLRSKIEKACRVDLETCQSNEQSLGEPVAFVAFVVASSVAFSSIFFTFFYFLPFSLRAATPHIVFQSFSLILSSYAILILFYQPFKYIVTTYIVTIRTVNHMMANSS